MSAGVVEGAAARPTLRAWLDQAWQQHAQQPREVAKALLERAAGLPDDADGAEALRLAEHVLLAHLGDATGLQVVLDALPLTPWLQAARQRAAWAVAMLSGQATARPAHGEATADAASSYEPAPVQRWRALQNVVLALCLSGRWQQARATLMAPESEALRHADTEARKAYAACANNVALELREAWPQGSASHRADNWSLEAAALMIDAAQLSRRAWAAAGTWLHVERAEYQLARCHAVLGHGVEAVSHAQACLSLCDAEAADAVERFFGHEAMAWAQCAAGDQAAAADARLAMQHLLADIREPEMRDWCEQALQALEPVLDLPASAPQALPTACTQP